MVRTTGSDYVYSRSEKRVLLMATCVATLINPLMGMMINLALNAIGDEFGVGANSLAFLVTLFFLSSVVFLAPAARLSEIYGKRKIYILGLAITAASGLLASFSPNFTVLCVFRVLMGVGSSMVLCTSLSMISDVFPAGERGFAIGINTAFVYIGASIGPVLGGVLTDTLGWRSTFYTVVPVALASMALMLAFRHEIVESPGEPFDYLGAVVYGVSIVMTMYGIMSITEPFALPVMAFGMLLLYYFYRSQKEAEYPVLRVTMFESSGFKKSGLTIFLNYAAAHSVAFFTSLYLQSIGALSATEAAALMFVQPVVQTVFTPISGKITDRTEPRYLMTLGMLSTLAGLVTLLFLDMKLNVTLVIAAFVLLGLGFSLFSAPSTTSMLSYCSPSEYSAASASVSILRQSAMMASLGIAMGIISIIMGSADNLAPENYGNFLLSMRVAWFIGIAMCALGSVVSWSIHE